MFIWKHGKSHSITDPADSDRRQKEEGRRKKAKGRRQKTEGRILWLLLGPTLPEQDAGE